MFVMMDQQGRIKLYRDLSKFHNRVRRGVKGIAETEVLYDVNPSRREMDSFRVLREHLGLHRSLVA